MDNTKMNAGTVGKEESVVKEENDLIITLKNPIMFEGQQYDKIDLTGLNDIKAKDMIDINRRMAKAGNTDSTQELTLEYAINMANIATGLPLEFFEMLPPRVAVAIKGRVVGFLFGRE